MKLQLELLHNSGGAQPQTVEKNVSQVSPSRWQFENGPEFGAWDLTSILKETFGFTDGWNAFYQTDSQNTAWKYMSGNNGSGDILVARAAIIQ